jgi:UDP-N-acetylmuramyl tripeptide synthase
MFGLWLGKLAALGLRLARRRATSLPGKIALRFSPKLLEQLGKQLKRCIVVTGTNGKTTTTALLAEMLKTEGPIIHNAEGANMRQGLATALIQNTNWFGRLKSKTALFEIDEATLPLVAHAFPIQILAVTNVFRDQLDRYGELDTTVEKIIDGIRKTSALVVLNADDPLARHIGLSVGGHRAVYFGMSRDTTMNVRDQMRDGAFCLRCGYELVYEGFFYGQLGLYRCPNCDFCRPHPDFIGHIRGDTLEVEQDRLPRVPFKLPVRGVFNMYNALCAMATARMYGISPEAIQEGLRRFTAPLGRMQPFDTSPPSVLNLIKNPTGCDSVLQAICADTSKKVVCIAINDLAADGRDVSWLWDADFEWLVDAGNVAHIVTSGARAEDMALRMKYAGYPAKRMTVQPDLAKAIDEALLWAGTQGGLPVYVVTTYTLLYPAAETLKRRAHTDGQVTVYRASVS